jgi:hypothetical protein
MRPWLRLFPLSGAALFTLAACGAYHAPRSEAAPLTPKQLQLAERQLGGKVAGAAQQCLPNSQRLEVVRVSDDMLIYRSSKNLVYRNDLRGTCRGLARDSDIMVVRQFGQSTCAGDFFHLVDRSSGIRGASCVFGEFVPYRKARAE